MAEPLIEMLHADPSVRLAAIERVGNDPSARYALRNAMLGDRDARVRAAAASRLGRPGEPVLVEALAEAATTDPMPLVREAAWRALAANAPIEAAARASTTDPVWWVRMAATAALGAIGQGAVEPLCAVLSDPFWRVRNTAANGILRVGRASGAVRQRVLARAARGATEAAALEFLRRRWLGESTELLEPAAEASPADPLWDADPAVTPARLEHPDATPSPALLIELLADPHESLRKRAAELLARSGDVRALGAAFVWLDEPRIPHAAQAVAELLGRSPEVASQLVDQIFAEARTRGAGVLIWAIGWVGATQSASLADAVRACLDHDEAGVREASIDCLHRLRLTETVADRLIELTGDVEPVQQAAVTALSAATPELARTLLDSAPHRFGPGARRELTRLARAHEHARWLRAAARDGDAICRAMALAALVDSLDPGELERARRDPDPWIRAAVITGSTAADVLRHDDDPGVRRAAMRLLLRRPDRCPKSASLLASFAGDPWLRARACQLLSVARSEPLARALALSFDRDPMVRAAAADALDRAADADVAALAADPGAELVVRKAAYTWLLRAFDDEAALRLARAYESTSDGALREHLSAIRIGMPNHEALAGIPLPAPRAPRPPSEPAEPAAIERRHLGATDLWVSPLALSGANDLAEGGLQRGFEAGVNLYFWEPRYLRLGRFLRRPSVATRVHVIAGSYHGSAERIEADVDTALRRLRRERIDLFLIFWVRSAERLSREIFDCLARLKEAGKIGAAGFSTHHRELAARAIVEHPWDAIMVRHSAAHTGAEDELFPLAARRKVGVLTFTALCYGRLLQPSPDHSGASAADCYRYSLAQPGVTAVISAPARHRELAQNLEVLGSPGLNPSLIGALRAHGRWVYSQSKDFNALIRRTPRRPPAALTDTLVEEVLIGEQ